MWTFEGVIGPNLAFPFHVIAIVKGFCKVSAPAWQSLPEQASLSEVGGRLRVADQGGGPVLEGPAIAGTPRARRVARMRPDAQTPDRRGPSRDWRGCRHSE